MKLAVRVAPRAGRNAIKGVVRDSAGAAVLAVSVTAPPDGGKANAALLGVLAKAWRLPKSAFSVTRGGAARRKTIHIAGDPRDLDARLRSWLADLDRSPREGAT